MPLMLVHRHFAARRKGVTMGWESGLRPGVCQHGIFAARRKGDAVEMGGTADVR